MRPRLLLAALPLLAGCGDGLVGGDYHGEPLLVVDGQVSVLEGARGGDRAGCQTERERCLGQAADPCAGRGPRCEQALRCLDAFDACETEAIDEAAPWEEPGAALRIALFWSGGDADNPSDRSDLEQAVRADAGFPATFGMTVYTPPPATVRHESDGGPFSLAILLAYLDSDGDGAWDPDEDRIVGGAGAEAVLYAEHGLSGGSTGDFAAGYHRVLAEAGCSGSGALALQPSDAVVELKLSVVPDHLSALLPDVDCDPSTIDWRICPPSGERLVECEVAEGEAPPPDPWRCAICAPPAGPGPRPGSGPGTGFQPTPPQ